MTSQSVSLSLAAIYDVLPCIISHLDPEHGWPQTLIRQALIALATAHSTFTKPALSALWRSLPEDDALNHLLCVLGIAKEVPREEGWSAPHLELCGIPNLREAGWKRFREYASFVRKIVVIPTRVTQYGSGAAPLLHQTFWCQIASILGDEPILPNLTAIHFFSRDSGRAIDMGAMRLLSPRIHELTIEFDFVRASHASTLNAAFASCFSSTPDLQRLTLMLPHSLLDLDAFPQSHPRLRYLKMHEPLSAQRLASIASLPALESLSINLSEPVNVPIQFTRLRSLSIGGTLQDATSLIISIDAPCLRDVSLHSSHRASLGLRAELSQCLHPLATRFPSLTGFHWSCSQLMEMKRGYLGSRDPGGTLAELLEPLLSLRALRDFSLNLGGPIVPYSHTDFRRMAEAWPNLESLTLELEHADDEDRFRAHNHYGGETSGFLWAIPSGGSARAAPARPVQHADVETFASFARCCPRLHTVDVPRVWVESAADVPCLVPPSGPECCPVRGRAGHGLRVLRVRDLRGPEQVFGLNDGPLKRRRSEVFREAIRPLFPFAAFRLPIVVDAVVVS